MRTLTILVLLSLLFIAVACYRSPEQMSAKRMAFAKKGVGDIVIAVFTGGFDRDYLDGIRMEVDRLNTTEGGLLGRSVQLFVTDDEGDFNDLRSRIRSVANNPKIIAVLGHLYDHTAVSASVIYEDAKLLFMPPFATTAKLTAHNFKFVLRGAPDENVIAAQTADIASLFGYKRIAILRSRDDYNRNLAFLFEDEVRERPQISVVFNGSFFGAQENYRSLLGQLKGIDFDVLYLAADAQPGARLVEQLRELGLDQPVLGSDTLYGAEGLELIEARNNSADRTIVPVIYEPRNTSYINHQFTENFRNTYGYSPNIDAAQGYNSMKILANIIKRAGTTNPDVLSTTAHWSPPMADLSGIRAYDTNGDIYGVRYVFRIMRFGQWLPLPSVNLPYAFNKFRAARLERMESNTKKEYSKKLLKESVEEVTSANMEGNVEKIDGSREQNNQGYEGLAKRFQRNFALAHELLKFKRLGLLLGHTRSNKEVASLVSTIAIERNIELERCELPSTDLIADKQKQRNNITGRLGEPATLEIAATACYSRLFRTVDAMFVIPDSGLEPDLLRRLNHAMRYFDVPTFAIDETSGVDYGLSMTVNTPDIGLNDPTVASRFDGLLKDMEVNDLNRKLSKFSTVAANLSILEDDLLNRNELIIVSEVLGLAPAEAASRLK